MCEAESREIVSNGIVSTEDEKKIKEVGGGVIGEVVV